MAWLQCSSALFQPAIDGLVMWHGSDCSDTYVPHICCPAVSFLHQSLLFPSHCLLSTSSTSSAPNTMVWIVARGVKSIYWGSSEVAHMVARLLQCSKGPNRCPKHDPRASYLVTQDSQHCHQSWNSAISHDSDHAWWFCSYWYWQPQIGCFLFTS